MFSAYTDGQLPYDPQLDNNASLECRELPIFDAIDFSCLKDTNDQFGPTDLFGVCSARPSTPVSKKRKIDLTDIQLGSPLEPPASVYSMVTAANRSKLRIKFVQLADDLRDLKIGDMETGQQKLDEYFGCGIGKTRCRMFLLHFYWGSRISCILDEPWMTDKLKKSFIKEFI